MKSRNPIAMKSSTQDKVEGTARHLAGKVEECTGKTVGCEKLESRGKSDQISGSAQKKIGEIKEKVFGTQKS